MIMFFIVRKRPIEHVVINRRKSTTLRSYI